MKSINQTLSDHIFIGIEEERQVQSYPAFHKHNVYEMYILTKGTRNMCIGNSVYKLCAGDVSMILPDIQHRSYGEEIYSGICIEFSEKILKKTFDDEKTDKIKDCFQKPIISLNPNMLAAVKERAAEYEIKGGDEREFLTFISEMISLAFPATDSETKRVLDSDMSPIGAYIQENYLEINGLDELATKFGITKTHLCHVFKKQTGMSVIEYIHRLKVQYACVLIQETEMPMSEIAVKCGFGTVRCFNKIFKDIVGNTPMYIRKYAKQSKIYIREDDE